MAAEEYFLWRQEAQANSVPYKQILLAKTAIQASSLALSLEKDLFEDIKSGEIRAGTIILVEEDGVVPVDGIIIGMVALLFPR
jgi:high-affinity K+ transport system ATPase subunit B